MWEEGWAAEWRWGGQAVRMRGWEDWDHPRARLGAPSGDQNLGPGALEPGLGSDPDTLEQVFPPPLLNFLQAERVTVPTQRGQVLGSPPAPTSRSYSEQVVPWRFSGWL